ncbi:MULTISPECIES: YhdT family protein [Gemella]|uniref:YhdT family protein n=1 Tax=Gemella TaxID=1378 RepID=UPI000767E3C2|nr:MULTISPECIES: YhdT family protein [Gemella]AME09788.1 hypothetical protein AXE85_06270 [Gemella sp. oral taxon 928]AXI27388.1 DUF997 domain-containing protein [Gemella sp. ND 6198]
MNRLKNKEGVVAVGLVIINFALWYYFAYIRYSDVDVKDYKYILGLPEWFFYSSIVVSVFIIILVIIFANLLFNREIKEEEK